MNIDERIIRGLCTDAVFERAKKYRNESRIRRIEQFSDVITAEVQGSDLYDVVVEPSKNSIDARCTCPYRGPGECKHVVTVLLDVVNDPPDDESERVEPVIEDVRPDDLRAFVRDVLAEDPDLRERFLARFSDGDKSIEKYREKIQILFDQHTQDYPVVTDAIDFSHFFKLAALYRDGDRYRAAATVYRALFEAIDDNWNRIDAAYDHYARTIQTALDGYVECVLEANPSAEEFEQYTENLAKRTSSRPGATSKPFQRALDDLKDHR